jgi:hypothetical protein
MAESNAEMPKVICYAFGIPSGEGKSALCHAYPELFVDHDELVAGQVLERLKAADDIGKWQRVNAYLRSLVFRKDRILLTWGPETCPSTHMYVGSMVLRYPTRVRANVANRIAIAESDREFMWFADFAGRDDALVPWARTLLRSYEIVIEEICREKVASVERSKELKLLIFEEGSWSREMDEEDEKVADEGGSDAFVEGAGASNRKCERECREPRAQKKLVTTFEELDFVPSLG